MAKPFQSLPDGQVAERFKAAVLKTAEVQASVGSNPTLSANYGCPVKILPRGCGGAGPCEAWWRGRVTHPSPGFLPPTPLRKIDRAASP